MPSGILSVCLCLERERELELENLVQKDSTLGPFGQPVLAILQTLISQ